VKGRCVCGCGGARNALHHVVYAQVVRREGGDVRDERNLVPVSRWCHAAHHDRRRPLSLHVLPDAVFEFAGELLGGPAAHAYLGRFYAGGDPRLDALLENEEAA
jgi:hypothetical protein